MKFLCLCHYDRARYEACTPEDFAAIDAICKPRDAALYANEHFVAVGSLAEPSDYAVLHAADGDAAPRVTRGPYASTPEPFGAFFLLDADSLEQAIDVASLHPGAHLARYFGGGIEVRPCSFFRAGDAAL